ncbi:MAG: hypothetical protein FWB78_09425 [Treponema sp.]|nr:hypothetical protein [Treponema sp.]
MKCLPLVAIALPLGLFLFSCASTQNIPYDLSPEQLIQRAQEASDRNRFNLALQFYQALLDRNPHNLTWVVNAEYEIAFIHYRQRNFGVARAGLYALLERYEAPGGEFLPEKFRVLAHVVLGRIAERENQRFSRGRWTVPAPPVEAAVPVTPPDPPPVEIGIEDALLRAAEDISRHLTAGAQIAVIYMPGGYAEYIASEIEYHLYRQGFTIVDRAELQRISYEQQLALTSEVDGYIAARIGYAAGASVAITSRVVVEGDLHRLNLWAFDTSTAVLIGTAFEEF